MNLSYQPFYTHSWSLIIGINEYEHLPPLDYAANDARDVLSVLINTLGFEENKSTILLDSDANKDSILGAYLDFISQASSPDDRIVFFFAGHGLTLSGYKGHVGYLAPYDAKADHPSTLIRWDELTRNADLIPAKHIFFILDACFSGLALKRAIYPGSQRFLSDMLSRRSRQVVTAGKADQVVADGGGPSGINSIFTGYLLEGLSGKANSDSGVLTANGLIHYIYENLSQDPDADQTPHMGHVDGDGDFVLVAPEMEINKPLGIDQILQVPKEDHVEIEAGTSPKIRMDFAITNGYENPSLATFARNQYSERLGYIDFTDGRSASTALSWLALVFEPSVELQSHFEIKSLTDKFREYSPIGSEPFERFLPPRTMMTSLNSLILYETLTPGSDYWSRFVRFEKVGAVEFADSYFSYFSYKDMRSFRYVQIIGMLWQFIHLIKEIQEGAGYSGGGTILLNLVGTKGTILSDFASGKTKNGRKWLEPGERGTLMDGEHLLDLKCLDPNIQIRYEVVLGSIDAARSKEIISDAAIQLGLAYNHQSDPRCFNFLTEDFPWNQFFSKRR